MKLTRTKIAFISLAAVAGTIAWFAMPEKPMKGSPMTTDVDAPLSEAIARGKVYFGHQSVGGNILKGIGELKSADPKLSAVNVVEIAPGAAIAGPGIYHSKVGKNRDTDSKTTGFEEILNSGVGDKVDAAVLKFCYVDINAETDVKALLENYTATVDRIQKRFPKLTLVHATIPLTTHGGGLKKTLKNWIKGDKVNMQRSAYNEMLRERFGKSGLVFDVANAESTLADGTRVTFKHRGNTYEAVSPSFTEGAGHLNEAGSRHVGAEFLRTIGRALLAKNTVQ
jgi:hypothetical protein